MPPTSNLKRLSQAEIYQSLRIKGSTWLKNHVLYADRQVVVLNKPPGLVCQLNHNVNERHEGTQDLMHYFRDIYNWLSSDPHHVHRLDKGTTGCLLLAVNETAGKTLSQQFRQKSIQKRYLALVQGGEDIQPGTEGYIDSRLAYRNGRGSLSNDGKAALTKWKLLASSPVVPLSLLQLDLLTGLKHQLRLHLSGVLSTPILGDNLYANPTYVSALGSKINLPKNRVYLHASEVSLLKYRSTGQRYRLNLRSPLPRDFQQLCREADIVVPDNLEKASLTISETRTLFPLEHHPQLWQNIESSHLNQLQLQSRE
ncbi:pseudouridine synthase [Crepidotus variabilis]|uniref:21S rRNA pseudouridine(2819) synthase n=1 Tax=Crepidotus variabilis TaxID=179855 RepID=A0A9P6EHH7_9AGAR|nr:pseudouridine synthase [Crepidotus variabilis]